MNILKSFWHYWKWVCVALMSTFVVLALLAAIITYFKSVPANGGAGVCIESGGTWNAESGECHRAG